MQLQLKQLQQRQLWQQQRRRRQQLRRKDGPGRSLTYTAARSSYASHARRHWRSPDSSIQYRISMDSLSARTADRAATESGDRNGRRRCRGAFVDAYAACRACVRARPRARALVCALIRSNRQVNPNSAREPHMPAATPCGEKSGRVSANSASIDDPRRCRLSSTPPPPPPLLLLLLLLLGVAFAHR